MADTVERIESYALCVCKSLEFVKLSRNLEYIGEDAFGECESLTSIFIPLSCREILRDAFWNCKKLLIFHVPQHTELGRGVISHTALLKASPFSDRIPEYSPENQNISNEIHQWIKNINANQEFALHRACSAYDPLFDIIYQIVKRQGLRSLSKANDIGITPLQYLEANPYAEIKELKIANRYILDMMGEIA
ncbi:hypothetical protein CTEN210_18453 [Chaetoceros tenuissimus]|uniref:Leucine-rich repeat domain-containing protein n=1 Tax=Chaetoceros tenuissimus TaxID=426638 RepID=A0AAD3DCH1_9STRA|nr:hypothetical protein CTEN210_18453 [Chaetoceros tenuissimus]